MKRGGPLLLLVAGIAALGTGALLLDGEWTDPQEQVADGHRTAPAHPQVGSSSSTGTRVGPRLEGSGDDDPSSSRRRSRRGAHYKELFAALDSIGRDVALHVRGPGGEPVHGTVWQWAESQAFEGGEVCERLLAKSRTTLKIHPKLTSKLRYYIRAQKSPQTERLMPLQGEIDPTEQGPLHVSLEVDSGIHFRVQHSDGTPARAHIEIAPADENLRWAIQELHLDTNESGSAIAYGLACDTRWNLVVSEISKTSVAGRPQPAHPSLVVTRRQDWLATDTTVVLPIKASFFGVVKDTFGRPVPGALIWTNELEHPRATHRTDFRGRFGFPGLPVGSHRFFVDVGDPEEAHLLDRTVDQWSIQIPVNGVKDHVFTVRPTGTIRARVHASKLTEEPNFRRYAVICRPARRGSESKALTSSFRCGISKRGRIVQSGLRDGETYGLLVLAYPSGPCAMAEVVAGGKEKKLTLTPSTRVSGTLHGALDHAWYCLVQRSSALELDLAHNGRFTLGVVPPGSWDVVEYDYNSSSSRVIETVHIPSGMKFIRLDPIDVPKR